MIKAVGYPVIVDLDGNSVYSVYVDNELVFSGRSIGPDIDIAPLLRDCLNSERIIIDWPIGEGIENATPQLNAGMARIYKEATEDDTKIYVIIDGPAPDTINLSGRVEDIASGVGISGASVSISLGGYQIAAVTTDQAGGFAYQWRISESEYNSLIAAQGSALRWSVQKNGYTAKEVQTNMPVYTEAVLQGITNTIVLVNPSDFRVSPNALTLSPVGGTANLTVLFPNNNWSYTASEDWFNVSRASNVLTITAPANTTEYKRDGVIRVSITMSGETITVEVPVTQDFPNLMSAPVGLDFRGRTVEFFHTGIPMYPGVLFDGTGLRSSIPWPSAGGFEILFTHDGDGAQIIIRGDSGSTEPDHNFNVVIWNEVDGWLQTSFTFPDDGYPFIVGQNDLLGYPSEGPLGYWWPYYTIITD